MSKKFVKYEVDGGGSIVFETDEPESDQDDIAKAARKNKEALVENADEQFNKVVENIHPAAQAVLDSLSKLKSPKEIQLEFGLKFGAKAGMVFASVDSEVHMKVAVKWENPGD